jgi:hypothetical protein
MVPMEDPQCDGPAAPNQLERYRKPSLAPGVPLKRPLLRRAREVGPDQRGVDEVADSAL